MAENELTVPELDADLKRELAIADGDKAVRYLRYQAKETAAYLEHLRPRVRSIPNFWLVTLTSHERLSEMLSSRADMQALSYLEDIELVQDASDFRPYQIIFHFKENPYFTNTSLAKKYTLKPNLNLAVEDGTINDELRDFDASTDYEFSSTKIDWKSDENDLCKNMPRDSQNADEVTDLEPGYEGDIGSFFWYFTAADDIFDIGDILRNDLLPEAYAYFDGRGSNQVEPDSDAEEDELDEEGGDDEDEIDLEDSEDERPDKKKRKL